MGVPLQVEDLVLGAEQPEEIRFRHAELAQQRRQTVGVMLGVDDEGVVGGHVLAVERVFVRGDRQQEPRAALLHEARGQRQIVRGVEQLALRHAPEPQIVVQARGVIEPAVRAVDHAFHAGHAEDLAHQARIGVDQLVAEGEMLVEILLEGGEKAEVRPAVLRTERGERGERPVLGADRGRTDEHAEQRGQAERQAEEKEKNASFFHIRPLP